MGTLARMRVTIPNAGTTSNEIDLTEWKIVGLQFAASVEGATVSFLGRASDLPSDGLSAKAVVDNAGNALSITATDDSYICLDQDPLNNLQSVRFLTVVSASSETGAQTVWLVCESRL